MWWRLFLSIATLMSPYAATGEPSPMAAAGRLETHEERRTCSAALVEPRIVVTAAHCAPRDPAAVLFRPGGKVGDPVFAIDRILRHPLYDPLKATTLWRYRFDVAVLRLSEPVPAEIARPFTQGPDAIFGEKLFLVSWRSGSRPRQRMCEVIPGHRGLVTLGCHVENGESGAPVLRVTSEGVEIVAIVSSRTSQGPQPVAQASNVRLRVPPLIRSID